MNIYMIFQEYTVWQILVVVFYVVIFAVLNERVIEVLQKVGVPWFNSGENIALMQTVFGAFATGITALLPLVGVEWAASEALRYVLEAFGVASVLLPIVLQAGLAKLFHELWKKIGWVVSK